MSPGWRDGGFFLARTPLLPQEVFWRLADGESLGPDLLDDPTITEALALSSPAFMGELRRALDQGPLDPALHRTLVRYLVRMSTRATPLGLLAGCSWGQVSDGSSRVELAARDAYRRSVRPDVRFQALIADDLVAQADEETFAGLLFRTHPDARVALGCVRLSRLRHTPAGDAPELVEVAAEEPLVLLLDRAREAVFGKELVAGLLEAGYAADGEEASEFVRAVVEAGLLLSEVHPTMTGPQLHRTYSRWDARVRDGVPTERQRALTVLGDLDGEPLTAGRSPDGESWLDDPGADFGPGPVLDLWKPAAAARLGAEDVGALAPALDLLSRLSLWSPHPALEAFSDAFLARYDEQWELDTLPLDRRTGVPLLEALDPETGIEFGGGESEDLAPVIDGLRFPSTAALEPRHPHERYLLDTVVRHAVAGSTSWELDAADLATLATADAGEFPDSVAVTASRSRVGDASAWVVQGVSGPAAMSRIARFTAADPGLLDAARRFCEREEADRPEATFVDFIHQPPGRAANLAAHPSLRRHEGHLFGVGAEEGEVVRLDDLRLTMRAGRLLLFSAVTGREVLPRLPSSYNYEISPFALVRFLGALQHGRARRDLGWDWGALGAAPVLPRVTIEGVVLAPARWRLSRRDLADVLAAEGPAALVRAASALRDRHRLPRLVGITEDDLVLPVDLDSPALLDQLVAAARREDAVQLTELYLDRRGDLLSHGPEGSYAHEVVVPFHRPHTAPARVSQRDDVGAALLGAPPRATGADRPLVYPPSSEWLYAEIYCGSVDVDKVLVVLAEHLAAWQLHRWFFMRYETTGWHLRLRLHGDPGYLLGTVLPTLRQLLDQDELAGRISRWTLESYRPEVERYGGPEGLEVCHDIFHADSDAFLRLAVADCIDDPDLRWQLALRAGHDLLIALGLDLPHRLRLVETARDRFRWEHEVDRPFLDAVGDQYRQHRGLVDDVLAPDWSPVPGVAEALAERAERIAAAATRLDSLWAEGRLNRPLTGIAPSLLHLSLNRFLRSQQRPQETVLYDYLARALRSQLARR